MLFPLFFPVVVSSRSSYAIEGKPLTMFLGKTLSVHSKGNGALSVSMDIEK